MTTREHDIINPMAVERGIQFIDGSHLFASIGQVWRDRPELKDHKLKVNVFTDVLSTIWSSNTGPLIRTIYYFKKGDTRLKTMLEIPSASSPNLKSHWQINECAQSVSAIPETEISKLDPKYHDQFHKAEKGLDMELACDALQFVATGRIDAVVLLVNDRDYIPLFKAVQRLGANTYLTAIDSKQPIQKDLAEIADSYRTLDGNLNAIFGYTPPPAEIEA
jgi:uncharacterized LabA/DUF88 family protein